MEEFYVISLVKRAITSDLIKSRELPLLLHIGGGPGTGKSTLVRQISEAVATSCGGTFDNLMVLAPTWTSANNVNGRTIQSAVTTPRGGNRLARFRSRWKQLRFLICDDVSMVSTELLRSLEEMARAQKGSVAPFGGAHVLLFGDILGLQPIEGNPIFQSEFWCLFRYVHLTENLRCADTTLAQICSLQREAKLQLHDLTPLSERRVSQLSTDEIALFAYAAHIYPSKSAVNEMNIRNDRLVTRCWFSVDRLLERCTENETSNTAISTRFGVFREYLGFAPQRDIRKLMERDVGGLSHTVGLYVGATVMLRIDLDELLVAGVTGVVLDLDKHPLVSFKTRVGVVKIRVKSVSAVDEVDPSVFVQRTQLPLLQSQAFTVHSVQGCTLERVVVHLPRLFSASLALTAFSRVRSLQDLIIDDSDTNLANIINNGPSKEALCEAKRLLRKKEIMPVYVEKQLRIGP